MITEKKGELVNQFEKTEEFYGENPIEFVIKSRNLSGEEAYMMQKYVSVYLASKIQLLSLLNLGENRSDDLRVKMEIALHDELRMVKSANFNVKPQKKNLLEWAKSLINTQRN